MRPSVSVCAKPISGRKYLYVKTGKRNPITGYPVEIYVGLDTWKNRRAANKLKAELIREQIRALRRQIPRAFR